MKIYAIIPAYNEQNTIFDIVRKAKKYCPVIVVDDGSIDGTAKLAEKVGAIVIKHDKNKGYGRSLIDGINEALRRKADLIITLDADGQHNPDDIPKFIEALNNGYNVVSSSRFLSGKSWGTRKRMIAIKLLTYQAWLFSGLKLTDIQSGFRGYNSKIFDKIKLEAKGMDFSVEILIKAKRFGYSFVEIPIEIKKPYSIKSFWSALKQGLEVGEAIIKYSLF